MRLAILGAFPYPYPQGSQIFVTDQSRALQGAGADPVLLTYGRGIGEPPPDLTVAPSPRFLSPDSMRSGPSWQKLPADAALCATYLREHRRAPFDLALAHNAEAAMIALAGRAITGVPVLYVVHTLLRFELSSYAHEKWGRVLNPIGIRIDDFIARKADGILALCDDAVEFLGPKVRGPIRVCPPGLDPDPPPDAVEIAQACERHDLTRNGYALYSGNLDGYQDLDLLVAAARELARDGSEAPQIIVATHHRERAQQLFAGATNLRCVEVADFAEMRALTFGAQSLVLTRRRRGGFPIKLLNYMEAGRPIVAIERIAPGFAHGENAWLLAPDAGAQDLAEALRSIARDAELAERLGRGARALLESRHAWPELARETLELGSELVGRRT
jgi:1,2-diacylglycerol 3-alpha-glucosyltransferase